MTTFDDRERAFEMKFAQDEEMKFRMIARRNRLLGEWAARLMKLSPAETEAYAKDVIRADFEEAGDDDVIRKVLDDITALIRAAIPDAEVTIRDLAGDGDHYSARVVSASFAGLSRVRQHQAVYAALGGRMGGELHALQLETAVPSGDHQ
jgi:hypothetical protein